MATCLLRTTCAVAVASSASLCVMVVACIERERERELGEELYQRVRGTPSGRTCAIASCALSMLCRGRTRRRCAGAMRTRRIGRTSRHRPRVSATRDCGPTGAPARICVRESGESRLLEGAAPHRLLSTVSETGEDATCRCRSTVRESGMDTARLCSYERERRRR
jgi:hypothetical protein